MIHRFSDSSRKECDLCSQELASIWKRLAGRTKKHVCQIPFTRDLTGEWVRHDCAQCSGVLVKVRELGSRMSMSFRFITSADAAMVELWASGRERLRPDLLPLVESIGKSEPRWGDEVEYTPCSVKLKSGEIIDRVELVVPRTPPVPNRLLSNAETDKRWRRYAGLIPASQVAEVHPSPHVLARAARQDYGAFYYPGEDRVDAPFLNLEDAEGRRVTVNTPPPTWLGPGDFDFLTAKPISTARHEKYPTLGNSDAPVFAVFSSLGAGGVV